VSVPLRPGRYLLDAQGRLHRWRRRNAVNAVAVVTVRPIGKGISTPGFQTADRAGGCEGRAAEGYPAREPDGPIGPVTSAKQSPVNARQPRTKIDLSAAPSAMETLAETWRRDRQC
jgi:hypothetical protein